MTLAQGGQSGLSAGVGSVCPLGQEFIEIKACGIVGMCPEICTAFCNVMAACLYGSGRVHIILLIRIEIISVIPTVSAGGFLHAHGKIGHGGHACFQCVSGAQFVKLLYTWQNTDGEQAADLLRVSQILDLLERDEQVLQVILPL